MRLGKANAKFRFSPILGAIAMVNCQEETTREHRIETNVTFFPV